MTHVTYVVQRPGYGPAIMTAYRDLTSRVPFNRLTGLYAFASRKGARLFCDAIGEVVPAWANVSKRWVISIDGGVTEPDALRYLLRQRKAEVRVPDAEELLHTGLRPLRRFHPKTLLLESQGRTPTATGLVVGSANLTCNGLCLGHEHAMCVELAGRIAAETAVSRGLTELRTVVESATPIDEDFIRRYESIRPAAPSVPEDFEDARSEQILRDRAVLPAAEAASLASANNLWVEVDYVAENRGRGQEGNQIDLKRGTRVFFGFGDEALPRNSPIGNVTIRFAHHSASRNLRFGNNQMDKLDLPIPGEEGPPSYRNQTLRFSREPDGAFRLTVGGPGDLAAWRRRSRELQTLFTMRSGRQYGVF